MSNIHTGKKVICFVINATAFIRVTNNVHHLRETINNNNTLQNLTIVRISDLESKLGIHHLKNPAIMCE